MRRLFQITRCWFAFAGAAFILIGGFRAQSVGATGWQTAEPGYTFHFPADHGPHPTFRTEWWYFTGNLAASDGREFGFELTFFRHGYRPPEPGRPQQSPFATGEVKFAHFTVTDVNKRRFYASEKTSRGALGEAGFNDGQKLVWIEDWQIEFEKAYESGGASSRSMPASHTLSDGNFRLRAADDQHAIDLLLTPSTAPVLQGDHGFSRKAAGPGKASYYYSIPILQTQGTVRIGASTFAVAGTSWFDREWATNDLAPEQAGWDWFAIQFKDGSSLMLYRMRLKDGGVDPYSNGTYVAANGQTTSLKREDF
ncbi:MAG: hypothetical protein JO069_13910, partial [Verrucomicrobia bacterium]|nr:hypothetical protein [Verrucomicrobiota bacterium]